MDNVQNLKLIIKRLKKYQSKSGTVLISLYVPGKISQVNMASKKISSELAVSASVKSKETRTLVQSGLRSLLAELKSIKQFPTTGLAFFAGSDQFGKLSTICVHPLQSIKADYKCDKSFHTEQLEAQLNSGLSSCIALLDGSSMVLGEVQDGRRTISQHKTTVLPKKHGRGGQSAARFGRQRV